MVGVHFLLNIIMIRTIADNVYLVWDPFSVITLCTLHELLGFIMCVSMAFVLLSESFSCANN